MIVFFYIYTESPFWIHIPSISSHLHPRPLHRREPQALSPRRHRGRRSRLCRARGETQPWCRWGWGIGWHRSWWIMNDHDGSSYWVA
jgi:hypothetical protein